MATKKMEQLKAANLHIDERVQRAEEKLHVNKLAANWDENYVGVLTGSRRADGKVYLLDGFQRMSAVRDRLGKGDYSFTVQVYVGLTLKEEAEIFLAFNRDRKAVTPYAKFLVGLTAGDPVCVAVNDTLAELGLHVSSGSSRHGVPCVATLTRIVGGMGHDMEEQQAILGRTMATFQEVWGNSDMDLWRSEVVEALAVFYMRHGNKEQFSQTSLVRVLRKFTISQLLTASKSRTQGRSNRATSQMTTVIEEAYDRGKSKGRLRVVA